MIEAMYTLFGILMRTAWPNPSPSSGGAEPDDGAGY